MQINKPIMSAVAGYAVAGGLEFSLLGDTRVAEEDVVFGVFCRKLVCLSSTAHFACRLSWVWEELWT
jgi:enoyl-CoA hydratase/carnithine racemase